MIRCDALTMKKLLKHTKKLVSKSAMVTLSAARRQVTLSITDPEEADPFCLSVHIKSTPYKGSDGNLEATTISSRELHARIEGRETRVIDITRDQDALVLTCQARTTRHDTFKAPPSPHRLEGHTFDVRSTLLANTLTHAMAFCASDNRRPMLGHIRLGADTIGASNGHSATIIRREAKTRWPVRGLDDTILISASRARLITDLLARHPRKTRLCLGEDRATLSGETFTLTIPRPCMVYPNLAALLDPLQETGSVYVNSEKLSDAIRESITSKHDVITLEFTPTSIQIDPAGAHVEARSDARTVLSFGGRELLAHLEGFDAHETIELHIQQERPLLGVFISRPGKASEQVSIIMPKRPPSPLASASEESTRGKEAA